MNIIVHYPSNKENYEALHKKVAIEHANFVINYISNLDLSKNEKLELLEKLNNN